MSERVGFVTGAASGLGRAIAERLSADGLAVAVADVDVEGAETTVKQIEEVGGAALVVECDVGSPASVERAAAAAADRFGGIDCLVNNAGFDIPGFFLASDPAIWDRLIAVNLMGVLNCIYAIAPRIVERCEQTGYGRIVNIASDAGRVGSLGEAVYSAAKGGVIAFSKSMARELARDKVTVNAICPGPADTPMTDRIRETELGEKLMEKMIEATPLRRLVHADEVAAAVSYFASDKAAFVTAQVLSLNGGLAIT
ncbi:MAG: SDR family NAD(P)-dependent oxidoreductase [Actinomycetota bacterium]